MDEAHRARAETRRHEGALFLLGTGKVQGRYREGTGRHEGALFLPAEADAARRLLRLRRLGLRPGLDPRRRACSARRGRRIGVAPRAAPRGRGRRRGVRAWSASRLLPLTRLAGPHVRHNVPDTNREPEVKPAPSRDLKSAPPTYATKSACAASRKRNESCAQFTASSSRLWLQMAESRRLGAPCSSSSAGSAPSP